MRSAADLTLDHPSADDIATLVADMRECDAREIIASCGPDRLATVRRSVDMSTHCLAIRDQHGVLAIIGTAPVTLMGDTGIIWMLATRRVDDYPMAVARLSKRYVEAVLDTYPLLTNYVDARNEPSIKLLAWLGFTIGEPEPFGQAQIPFRPFSLRRPRTLGDTAAE